MKTHTELTLLHIRAMMRAYAMEWRKEKLEPTDSIIGLQPGEQAKFYLQLAKDYREMALPKDLDREPGEEVPF